MALVPLPHALGLDASAVAMQQNALFIQAELSFSGGDFHVKDSFGREIIVCKGKALSLSQRTEFFTPNAPSNSPPIFVLRKHKLTFLDKFYLEDSSGQEIMQINRKFHFGGIKFAITFANLAHDSQPIELIMKGSLFERSAVISWNDVPIANVRKNITAGSFIGKDRYSMEIAPGCDMVLFSAMIVCLDEAYRDQEKN